MIWDCRSLIRRGGGQWPRDWRDVSRDPVRPPGGKPEKKDRPKESGDPGKERDERWLEPRWQPPPDAADGWKK